MVIKVDYSQMCKLVQKMRGGSFKTISTYELAYFQIT